jgi:PEP-CTERM motif
MTTLTSPFSRLASGVLALTLLCASTASAGTVLLSDNFSRGAVTLNGLAPSGGGGTLNNAGGTWVSSTTPNQVQANGTAISNGAGNASAILNLSSFGITIAGGNIYRLKATVSPGFSSLITGFSDGSLATSEFLGQNNGDSGILNVNSGQIFATYDGPGSTNGTSFASFSGGFPTTMETVLDTSSSNWTIGYSVNGTQYIAPHTFTGGNPSISQIALSSFSNTTGSVSSFSFEVEAAAVPEPSRMMLLGLAGGLGFLRRRRASC